MSKIALHEYVTPNLSQSKVFMEDSTDALGNKGKTLHMAGIFIQGGVRNQNQRVYPVEEIRRAVDSINGMIKEDIPIFGALDHPDDLKIELDRASHVIVEMKMDGPNGYGKLKLLPTPMGNIAKAIIESGVKLGVSSRGSGNVNESTGHVSDFEIVTVDIVAQPSAPNAWPTPIYEGLMNSKHGYKTLEMAAEAKYDPRVQKYLKEEICRLIKDMKLR